MQSLTGVRLVFHVDRRLPPESAFGIPSKNRLDIYSSRELADNERLAAVARYYEAVGS